MSNDQLQDISSEILATNYIPSPEEVDLIRNYLIPIHYEKCLALDAQVQRARTELAALETEQQAQHDLLHAHKALLASMRRLIPDLLLEIFHHCHNQFVEAPMCLGRVCRKWRELVHSTPTLWTLVLLQDTMQTRRIVPFSRACVAYSGSCPIKVVLKFMHRQRDHTMRQALFDALVVVTQHVHRWQTLEISIDKTFKPDDVLKVLPDDAPLLERMVLRMDRTQSLPFSYLPRLRDLILSVSHPQDIPMLLRCTQLRILSIGGASSELTLMDCWTILSNCPDIEVFIIACVKSDMAVLSTEAITLSCLRDMRIGPHTSDPAPLIHCMKTPVLERLRLIAGRSMDSSCVRRLVQESRPPLTCLSLVHVHGTDVARCIPFLPNLESLTLQHTESMDDVISSLTEQDGDGGFNCPTLVYFCLRICIFTGAHMVRMAEERRGAARGLRVLVDSNSVYKPGDFVGLTIELSLVGGITHSQLQELHNLQTELR